MLLPDLLNLAPLPKIHTMKKLLLSTFCIISTLCIRAQTVTFATITPPCDSNGVVVATFTGLTLPFGVTWYCNGTSHTDSVYSGTTDTLKYFMGGNINIYADDYDTAHYIYQTYTADASLPFVVTPSYVNGICPAIGSGSVAITGGTGPFTYAWYNSTPSLVSTTNPTSLFTGSYTLKVSDAAGCFNYAYGGYVTEVLDFTADSSIYTSPAICPGIGSATVTPTGGTGSFTYVWKNIAGTVIGTANPMSLPVGLYRVIITESSGCADSNWVNIIYEPDFTLYASSTDAICPANGTATATTTGGTGTFTYTWKNGAGMVVGSSTTISVPSGYYQVVVTDGTGCIDSTYTNVNYVPDFIVSNASTPAVCPGNGTATITITGGTGPFTFSFSNTSGTIVGTSNPASLPAGNYLATITDAIGCVVHDDSIYIMLVPDFTAAVTTTAASCTNGSATVNVTGGVSPFSYSWSTGATSASISSLVPGYYYVNVTDALGCTNTSTLYGYVAQAITVYVDPIATPTTCVANSGWVFATVYGGTAPYSYLWSNGGTTDTITGLDGGYYNIRVTDVNGCVGQSSAWVSTIIPISITPPAVTASACTAATGTATISTISGGTPPYTIEWFTTPAQFGYTATGLTAGHYEYRVTDAAGCVKYSYVDIPFIYYISNTFTSYPASCTLADGSITAIPSGGVAPYTFLWSSSSVTTATISGITAGYHSVAITDANGCVTADAEDLPYTSPLTLGISSTPASCIFNADGSITATAASGTAPYTFSMGGTSSGSVTVSSLATGNYWIHVTDAVGCVANGYTYLDYNHSDSSCFCTVKGTVYRDLNSNCIMDAGEQPLNGVQMHLSYYSYTYTDVSGNYSMIVPSGTYTLSEQLPTNYSLSACQPAIIPITVVASTGCTMVENFADTLYPFHDLFVSTWEYSGHPIPGFSYSQITVISNIGTDTESTIQAKYRTDGTIYAPTFTPGGYFSGSPYSYNATSLPTLLPGDELSFITTYTVPASVPLGTILVFNDTVSSVAPLSTWLTDTTPWNNVDYYNPWVVGPYDPNFKEVKPKGSGPEGYISINDSVMQYMIHFQNTGTYPAQNVVVRDTIPSSLDWHTLKPVYASSKCVTDIDENGRVTFTFNNIQLPPSNSEPLTSNGIVVYTIKQRPGLTIGTQIKNSASIYFDFNAPIITQSTLNTIGNPSFVPPVVNIDGMGFNIYPNPADRSFTSVFSSENDESGSLQIIDITGKVLLTKQIALQKGTHTEVMRTESLAPGIYFVTFMAGVKSETQKLIIVR